ncbi:hypothetical protein LN426_19335 [Pseudomonas syringae]|uniref:hypothetical protein n=1 Tax=Pseudomonas syringae TaxID=317 RepID=UPI0018E5C778|nr:hypothetical protein [Pseudomonas syringae]MBI6558135.1 hypothetical protein [Pseudomonas syringae]MBI6569156.1 hypothetical protein [Pseudomonas syringae]MBI6585157.1 hypothetical protein [Pseudomonas syringae]MBI6595713.1 hypothetical protein [Pseudomonas syringae]MDC6494314.1 hypothetical protein [Pseudomonas syringae]
MGTVVIDNDESALALLETLLREPDAEMPKVEFENWPRFELHVKGERYHSTITPELMESFLDLQKTINKSFALLRYSDSSRRLTKLDREELKILVEVTDGSSGFLAFLGEQAQALIQGLSEGFKSMDSKHKLITFLALGSLGFGTATFVVHLEHQADARREELARLESESEREERLKTLELVKQASENSAERYAELMKLVVDRTPQIQTISDLMSGTYNKIISATRDSDSISLQGVEVPGAVVEELSNTPRNISVEDRSVSVFLIRGVDHRSQNEYKLALYDVIRKEGMTATLPRDDSFVTDQILDVIQEAEWGGKVVMLHLVTKTRAGKLIKAEVERVTRITDQDAYDHEADDQP